ncbi:MAG: type II toxin-antitoxin system ParD family antitoxin [Verrucomicrobia bacterium]|nr:type II toxin-antitoxin system ParD family antitoxin [Leptolyngbya sp. ES-bin-22]
MQNVEKMTIALSPEMVSMVKEAVESGDYVSSSEVVRDALRLWKSYQASRLQEIEALKALWQQGVESGSGRFSSMDQIKAEARRLAAAED